MKYETKKFKNGLRAMAIPMKSTQAVTTLVLVGTGSVYETRRINGISHFLEHLFFKGTKNHPEPGEINKILDGMGAEHNAFTSKEVTGFWVKSAKKQLSRSLDIISDILINPLFRAEEIERERGVILQEIAMYEDMPQRNVWSVFDELMYGDQPAGWDIAGTPEIVKGITRNDVLKYKASQYVAPNMLVIVAGNISPEKVFSEIEARFGAMNGGIAKEMKKVSLKQSTPRVKIKHKKSDQTHLILGAPAYDVFDERRHAAGLLAAVLGGYMSSRLFMEIRERLGLAYYVRASADSSTYGGMIAASAGVPHGDAERVVRKITDILDDVRENGVSDEELKFAKDHARGAIALSFESSDEVAMFFGGQALFKKEVLTPQEALEKMEKVSKNDILKVAGEILDRKNLNLAIIGPHKSEDNYRKILTK